MMTDARPADADRDATTALVELFDLLDAEDWHGLSSHLDERVQLADELTGAWLRGREAVEGYFLASQGVITGIRSRLDDVTVQELAAGIHCATFEMQQTYRLVGRARSENLTGLVIIRVADGEWSLLLFDLGTKAEGRSDAGGSSGEAKNGAATRDAGSLGERIKALRTQQGITLRALADRAQLSAGFLSEVERNLADPSVGSLVRIADGLGVSAASLVDAPRSDESIVVSLARQRHPVALGGSGLTVATLSTPEGSALTGHLRTYGTLATGLSGTGTDVEEGDSIMFVVSGSAELHHVRGTASLASGDAVSLLGGTEYRLRAIDESTTVLVVSRTSAHPPLPESSSQ